MFRIINRCAIVAAALLLAMAAPQHLTAKESLSSMEVNAYVGPEYLENLMLVYGQYSGAFREAGLDVKIKYLPRVKNFPPAIKGGQFATLIDMSAYCYSGTEDCNWKIWMVSDRLAPYVVMVRSDVLDHYRAAGGFADALYRKVGAEDEWRAVGSVNKCRGAAYAMYVMAVRKSYPNATIYCGDEDREKEARYNVVLRTVGNPTERVQAVVSGAKGVNTALVTVGQHLDAQRLFPGQITTASTPEDMARDFNVPTAGLVSLPTLPQKKGCAFVRGYRTAVKSWRADPEAAQEYLKRYYADLQKKLDGAHAKELYAISLKMFSPDGAVSPETQARWAEVMYPHNQTVSEEENMRRKKRLEKAFDFSCQ